MFVGVVTCVFCCGPCYVMVLVLRYVVFFFFKQKTAYEMRISDWSSDVCSSYLADAGVGMWTASPAIRLIGEERVEGVLVEREAGLCRIKAKAVVLATRSEESSVGQECVSTCRSRW